MRNIEKQELIGKKKLEKNMEYDLTLSEIEELVDRCSARPCTETYFRTLAKAFYFGVAVGYRVAKKDR